MLTIIPLLLISNNFLSFGKNLINYVEKKQLGHLHSDYIRHCSSSTLIKDIHKLIFIPRNIDGFKVFACGCG